jgi:hypothetical protein
MSRSFERYFAAALTRRVAELRDRGATRKALSRAASDLGQLLHLDGADERQALAELVTVTLAANPAASRDEVSHAVEAGFRAGRAKPYTPEGAAPAPTPTPTTAPTSAGDLAARVSHLEARLDRLAHLERIAALLDQGHP